MSRSRKKIPITAITGIAASISLILCFISCRRPPAPPIQPVFERILPDTTKNRRAKWELESLHHYRNLCKAIGVYNLYDGTDSLEIRVWRQFSVFGMAADEEIYSLKLLDSTANLTFYRVYCTNDNDQNFRYWDAYTDPRIDSFVAISKSFSIRVVDSMHLQDIWDLKTQSALRISDSIGFTDGTRSSIEIASNLASP